MSAICAVYRWDGAPVTSAQAESLLAALSEYGPGAAIHVPDLRDAPVALGCIPWRVTPEDACYRGPVRSDDGNVVVVVDARIDNREELARRLDIAAADTPTMSDAAFVLAAWERWRHDAPRHLVGDYAFALWDARSRELFCARDAMGQRVLFYHETPEGIALATTAHALTTLPHVRAELDEQKVADFLVLLQRPESTFYRGIRRLAPGHRLIADPAGVRVERYWSAEPVRMLRFGSDDDYVDGFLDVFETAVASQLRCASTVGMMTSGGLDSSSVGAVAAILLRERGRELPTFHAAPRAGYAGPVRHGMVLDESDDVEALARMHPNMQLHIRRTRDRTALDDLETSFRMTGAPARNPSNSAWFLDIYAYAAAEGVRVLLSGHKGNVTISQTGLRSLRDSAAHGQWGRVWRETHAIARATGAGRRQVLRREVVRPLTPKFLTSLMRRLGRGRAKPVWDATLSAIRPQFAHAMDVEARIRAANRHHDDVDRLSDMQYRLMVLGGGADVFDLYSGYRPWFGIETRDPTADRRVVEYCMAVPGSQYLRNGVTRSLLRRAMAGRLPDALRLRQTWGMQGPDWTEWLPTIRTELRAELQRLERSETAMRCLDVPKMRQLVEHWPEKLTLAHEKDYPLMLLRGITVGRFIRWFEDTYA